MWDGHGQPVLFFHGGGQTRHAWGETAQRLAVCGMRAIIIDQRGHGESDWVDSENYTFGHYAEDVAAIVKQVEERFPPTPVGCRCIAWWARVPRCPCPR